MSAPDWISEQELLKHFRKHGPRLGLSTVDEYQASALGTIQRGIRFEFEDHRLGRGRIGYYDRATNRLTVVAADGPFILSHYAPTQREQYVRSRPGSTYT